MAVAKPSYQSSTYGTEYASLANDGDYSNICSGNDPVGGANWWAVDLVGTFVVKYIFLVSVPATVNGKLYIYFVYSDTMTQTGEQTRVKP